MTESEHIENFKKENKENITKLISQMGGFAPLCTIFTHKNDNYGVIIVTLPEDVLDSYENKQKFLKAMPDFFDSIVEDGHRIVCFSYSSEAWLRTADKNGGVPDNWQSLPKIEALITSYETNDSVSLEIYNIIREGKIVDTEGDLIDCIRLEKNNDMDSKEGNLQGGFSTIYRDYLKLKN